MATESLGYRVKREALGGVAEGSLTSETVGTESYVLLGGPVKVPKGGLKKLKVEYWYNTDNGKLQIQIRRLRPGTTSFVVYTTVVTLSACAGAAFKSGSSEFFDDGSLQEDDWLVLAVYNTDTGGSHDITILARLEVY